MSALCPKCKNMFKMSRTGIICGSCETASPLMSWITSSYVNSSSDAEKAVPSTIGVSPTLTTPPKPNFDFTTATDCEILREFKNRFEGSTLYECKVAGLLDMIGDETIKAYLKGKKK